ncbi:MAG: zinc ribbon domain-containing protein [Vicinamibacterales bacterium]
MSSGISIDDGRLEPVAGDAGFRPWHFFVLASILLATVTVILARQSSPANLILLSLTVGAAGAAAAALYRSLLPFASPAAALLDEPLSTRRRATLEKDKMLALRSIKELEFDRAMGKLSQKDFEEMAGRLRRRALLLMKQLDEGAGYAALIEAELQKRLSRVPSAGVPGANVQGAQVLAGGSRQCQCGAVNDADAVFCKKCGTRLAA